MSISQVLGEYGDVVTTLKRIFAQDGAALAKGETADQFVYSFLIKNTAWLEQNLEILAPPLLQARFQIHVWADVHDLRIKMQLDCGQGVLSGIVAGREEIQVDEPGLPDAAVGEFDRYRSRFTVGETGILPVEFINFLKTLQAAGVSAALKLDLFFNKGQIGSRLPGGSRDGLQIAAFLFPEAFLAHMEKTTLESYERDFAKPGSKTVFIIFGYSGVHIGDTLAICGADQPEKMAEILGETVPDKVVQFQKDVQKFRKSQATGVNPTGWLIPESFQFHLDLAGQKEISASIRRQFDLYRGMLSAIFLADSVEKENDRYGVEYKGYGRVRIELNRSLLAGQGSDLENLFLLYHYAYEGFSLDKLEIAQQFLSLVASNLDALCSKAGDIKDATRKTYERSLSAKVEDYFKARHSIQERLKEAVEETTAGVIELSRAVSDDLYKIAGVIAAAVVGSFLEPKLTLWAAAGAGIVIGAYIGLVIFYHLRTVKDSYALKLAQHKAYIESYADILRDEETAQFLDAEHLGKAESMFSQKSRWAQNIYLVFLAAAVLVAVIAGIGLISGGSTLPGLPTPTP